MGFLRGLFLLEFGYFPVEELYLLLVILSLDGFAFDLKLLDPARDLVQLLRQRIHFHTQTSRSLIHQVDGLVGQEPLRNVAVRQLHGRDDGIILDPHFVVILVFLLQTPEDGDGA